MMSVCGDSSASVCRVRMSVKPLQLSRYSQYQRMRASGVAGVIRRRSVPRTEKARSPPGGGTRLGGGVLRLRPAPLRVSVIVRDREPHGRSQDDRPRRARKHGEPQRDRDRRQRCRDEVGSAPGQPPRRARGRPVLHCQPAPGRQPPLSGPQPAKAAAISSVTSALACSKCAGRGSARPPLGCRHRKPPHIRPRTRCARGACTGPASELAGPDIARIGTRRWQDAASALRIGTDP